jgi:hypothetical protein
MSMDDRPKPKLSLEEILRDGDKIREGMGKINALSDGLIFKVIMPDGSVFASYGHEVKRTARISLSIVDAVRRGDEKMVRIGLQALVDIDKEWPE